MNQSLNNSTNNTLSNVPLDVLKRERDLAAAQKDYQRIQELTEAINKQESFEHTDIANMSHTERVQYFSKLTSASQGGNLFARQAQDKAMNDMMSLLNGTEDKNTQLITNTKLSDALSVKRAADANILKTLSNLKNDTAHYPINVLDYASGISAHLGGAPLRKVRMMFVNTKKRIERNDIASVVDGIIARCEEKNNDSRLKRTIKREIIKIVREAKDVALSLNQGKIQTQNTF